MTQAINGLVEVCIWYSPQIIAVLTVLMAGAVIEQIVYRTVQAIHRGITGRRRGRYHYQHRIN
jgi:hypothetical protein